LPAAGIWAGGKNIATTVKDGFSILLITSCDRITCTQNNPYWGAVLGHILERTFLNPGNKVCDLCHVQASDDRTMIRTPVNMLVWNVVVVLAVVAFY
jgi:hypothetical protein